MTAAAAPDRHAGASHSSGAHALTAARVLTVAGVAALALPTLFSFYRLVWIHDEDTQAPVILAGILFAFWQNRALFDFVSGRSEQLWSLAIAGLGLVLYVLGRSQTFLQLEGLGLIVVVYGVLLLAGGVKALRSLSYVTALLLFVVPIPGSLIDAVLVALKTWLAGEIVDVLAILGYPIANHGVVISIGFEQLQVADACAGMHSLLSLSAIGLLFIYFIGPSNRLLSVCLVVATPFIALFANFVRVTTLVLVTYHLGSGAGAIFHDYAAYLEIAGAIVTFLAVHKLLEHLFREKVVR